MIFKHTTNKWLLALALLSGTAATVHGSPITFADFSDSSANQWSYTNGSLTAPTASATFISFGPPNQVLNYTGPVTYTVSATAAGAPVNSGGIISQALNGDITFKNGSITVLDVVFSGAIISGNANSNSSGASADTTIAGQVISYTSDASVQVTPFSTPYSFSIGLTQIPGISISGNNLANFTATASGSFSENQSGSSPPVPEPSSLSVLGVAAVGLLRRRETLLSFGNCSPCG